MSLNWNATSSVTDDLYNLLQEIEVPKQSQRFAIHMVDGNPTIGVGFDLVQGVDAVRKELVENRSYSFGM